MSSFPCLARFVSASGQVRYRLGDRLSARTIARRLSSVSGLYAYLVARGIRRCGSTRCRAAC